MSQYPEHSLDVERLLSDIRKELAMMTGEQRLAVFYSISDGYCSHCGRDDSKEPRGCQCWNDE